MAVKPPGDRMEGRNNAPGEGFPQALMFGASLLQLCAGILQPGLQDVDPRFRGGEIVPPSLRDFYLVGKEIHEDLVFDDFQFELSTACEPLAARGG